MLEDANTNDGGTHNPCNAVPELIVDAEIRRERPEAVQRYNRFAGAACAACLDLLTD